MAITLTPDDRKLAAASLERYFLEELDHKVGNIELMRFLDYLLAEIGPSIYNAAVVDASARLAVRLADLEGEMYQEEFQHWPQSVRRRHSR